MVVTVWFILRAARPLTVLKMAGLPSLALLLVWLRLGPLPSSPAGAQPPQAVTIAVGDRWFCDSSFQNGVCETVIDAGDTVVWDFSDASLPHTTTECGLSCDEPTDTPFWDSPVIADGSTFEVQFPFDQAGTYLYRCEVHPSQMRGRIIVQGTFPLPTPGPTITPMQQPGDVDCDSAANSIDATLVLQLDAGLVDALDCQQNGDVNGDSSVDSLDAALILQFDAGLIDSLPGRAPPAATLVALPPVGLPY